MEEQFGSSTKLDAAKDKKKSSNNAAIGYNYETEEPIPEPVKTADSVISEEKGDDEDSDIDLGTIILLNAIFNTLLTGHFVQKLTPVADYFPYKPILKHNIQTNHNKKE